MQKRNERKKKDKKMKIHFDITHPKQCMFFPPIMKELENRGHEIVVTFRIFGRSQTFITDLFKSKFVGKLPRMNTFGIHGKDRFSKLENYLFRSNVLLRYYETHKPDLLVCLSSPPAVRIAYGLGVPVVCFNDIPEATATAKLTLPYSTMVFSPFCVSRDKLLKFGCGNIYQYNCLDPIMWLKGFIPDERYLETDPYIVAKYTPTYASFNLEKKDIVAELVNYVIDNFGVTVNVITHDLDSALNTMPKANILSGNPDVQNLVANSNMLITGGGTTSIEAAYFGVPVVSCRPIRTSYDLYLVQNNLMFWSRNIPSLKEQMDYYWQGNFVSDDNPLHDMEFPMKEVVDLIEKTKEMSKV